jgi:carbon-monoxide dehydrogenase large subunit
MEVAAAVDRGGDGLECVSDFEGGSSTFPFGAYVAVVEVDAETGFTTLLRMLSIDDAGTIVNPMLAEGQVHGGIGQGIAQALFEEFLYDDDGNPLTSTFADYTLPTSADTIGYDAVTTETPTPLNPLGAKGIGESATIGATPAVQNAVVDALAHLGVRHVDMPCTPDRVWRAIEQARAGTLPDPWREPPAAFATLPSDSEGGSVTESAEI